VIDAVNVQEPMGHPNTMRPQSSRRGSAGPWRAETQDIGDSGAGVIASMAEPVPEQLAARSTSTAS